jgi:hypothetical protein
MSHLETRAHRARGGEGLEQPDLESRAWWTDVEHVRERIERRRALEGRGESPTDLDTALHEWAGTRESHVQRPRRGGSASASERAGGGESRRARRVRGQAAGAVAAPRARPDQPSGRAGAGGERRLPRPYAPPEPQPEVPPPRELPRPTISERLGTEPERLAAWSFAFALLLILAAATGHL